MQSDITHKTLEPPATMAEALAAAIHGATVAEMRAGLAAYEAELEQSAWFRLGRMAGKIGRCADTLTERLFDAALKYREGYDREVTK